MSMVSSKATVMMISGHLCLILFLGQSASGCSFLTPVSDEYSFQIRKLRKNNHKNTFMTKPTQKESKGHEL